MILAISGHEFLVYRTQDYTSEARRIRLYLSCIYLVRIPHILSGGNISLRGCVNPASCWQPARVSRNLLERIMLFRILWA